MQGKTRFGLLIGAITIVTVLSISFVAAKYNQSRNENTLETTLQVSRLSCGSCVATIEGELRRFDGMLDLRADLAQGLITVSHTDEFLPLKIAETITGAGYPAKVVRTASANGTVPISPNGYGCSGSGCGSAGCNLPPPTPERS